MGEKPRVKVARQVVQRKADSQTVGRVFQANWWMPKADHGVCIVDSKRSLTLTHSHLQATDGKKNAF